MTRPSLTAWKLWSMRSESVVAVIQCAAGKLDGAGRFISPDGRPVTFVAHPEQAPDDPCHVFVHPDDSVTPGSPTWRDLLVEYNRLGHKNPFGLLPAYRLYKNPAYQRLVKVLGAKSVYILSAGWGLIRSDFLTPYYDITISSSAENYKRRRRSDHPADFRHLSDATTGRVAFFGGRGYVGLFRELTSGVEAERIVFHNSDSPPEAPGCHLVRYETPTRTNWHYECVNDFLNRIVCRS